MANKFKCSICGKSVDYTNSAITRSCDHTGGVVAEISAHAYGRSHMQQAPNLLESFLNLFGSKFKK